ncbi:MAG: methylenetetrahydrofolate reductase C-terminal domain-containing protein [Deltaproteobacteria bacterium]|nr:methylenetetrahydrofolate reductase C-terminal domain-containing protein [Deltaproteobacteria bacterium]
MIITKKKDITEITENLKEADAKSVFLFGCDSCAEQCKTGGKTELAEMTETLTKAGFTVTGSALPSETCYNQLIKKEYRTNEDASLADATVVLACGAGVKNIADVAASTGNGTQVTIPALDSHFLSSVDRVGRFFEGCSLCGECVLDKTAGICPHTDCPKSMLNGPCGGVDHGKCEVIRENDCAWVRIYGRLKTQGRLDLMKKITPPKDHSRTTHPRKLLLR